VLDPNFQVLDRSQNYRIFNVRAIVQPLKYLSQHNSLLYFEPQCRFRFPGRQESHAPVALKTTKNAWNWLQGTMIQLETFGACIVFIRKIYYTQIKINKSPSVVDTSC